MDNYTEWFKIKNRLNKKKKIPYFKEREIWWCSLGLNVGFEQNGKNDKFERPILIIKKFNRYLFWSIPTTTKIKNDKHYYIFSRNNIKYSVILSQIKSISSFRLLRKIGMMNQEDFLNIKNKLIDFLK